MPAYKTSGNRDPTLADSNTGRPAQYAALANAKEPALHHAVIEPVAYADNNTTSAFAAAMAPCDALTR
jgi:hypothetical protein